MSSAGKGWSVEYIKLTEAARQSVERLRKNVQEDLLLAEQLWDDPDRFMFHLKRAREECMEVCDLLRLTIKGRI